jgi:hypothetical protein
VSLDDLRAAAKTGGGSVNDAFLAALLAAFRLFGPLPGCAAMITLLSHDGTCCIGSNVDPAAITQPGLFADCLSDGLERSSPWHARQDK